MSRRRRLYTRLRPATRRVSVLRAAILIPLLLAAAASSCTDDASLDVVDVLGARLTVDDDRGCYQLGESAVVATREPRDSRDIEQNVCPAVAPARFGRRALDDACFFMPTFCPPDDGFVFGSLIDACGLNLIDCAECPVDGCPRTCAEAGLSPMFSAPSYVCYGPSTDDCSVSFGEASGTLGSVAVHPLPDWDAMVVSVDGGVLIVDGFPPDAVAGWSGLDVDVRVSRVRTGLASPGTSAQLVITDLQGQLVGALWAEDVLEARFEPVVLGEFTLEIDGPRACFNQDSCALVWTHDFTLTVHGQTYRLPVGRAKTIEVGAHTYTFEARDNRRFESNGFCTDIPAAEVALAAWREAPSGGD